MWTGHSHFADCLLERFFYIGEFYSVGYLSKYCQFGFVFRNNINVSLPPRSLRYVSTLRSVVLAALRVASTQLSEDSDR